MINRNIYSGCIIFRIEVDLMCYVSVSPDQPFSKLYTYLNRTKHTINQRTWHHY